MWVSSKRKKRKKDVYLFITTLLITRVKNVHCGECDFAFLATNKKGNYVRMAVYTLWRSFFTQLI